MLSDAQINEYQQNGYVVVPGLFDTSETSAWKAQLQAKLTEEKKLDEPSGVRVWMCDGMDSLTEANVQKPQLVQMLNQLIGPDVEFLSVKAVFKNSKTSFNSPWHQDWHYWQGSPKISIWIALDNATPENGCLRLVPGSHRNVVQMDDVEDGKGFGHRIGEDALADLPVETVPVSAGDVVFFHDLALHASCPNVNGQDRWTAIATYRSGSEVDGSTVWETFRVLSGESVN
ncbi:MAG: phytanoyl-CoA dioxygenase family protein [Chloroflexota bacterium]